MKKYVILIEMGASRQHSIEAKNLLDLFNQLEKYKSKHTIYNDEIISIQEQDNE